MLKCQRARSAAVFVVMLWGWLAPDATASTPTAFESALEAQIHALGPVLTVDSVSVDTAAVRQFYEQRANAPLWIEEGTLNGRANALRATLKAADAQGLDPALYDFAMANPSDQDPNGMAEMELSLTAALIDYATRVGSGQVSPRQADPDHFIPRYQIAPLAALEGAAATNELTTYLDTLAPESPIYRGLLQSLAHYRQLEAAGGWGSVPEGPSLHPGETDTRVPLIQDLLRRTGDLTEAAAGEASPHGPSLHYDNVTEAAVRRFQERHGLEPDGVVGSRTTAAMNVPVQDRIKQILVNIERWRWLPRDLGAMYVLVNMAGFELELVQDDQVTLDMRVIVGQPVRQTPAFSDEITYIELNPYWNVPRKIALEEILPKARRDPGVFFRQGMRIYARDEQGTFQVDPYAIDWQNVNASNFPFRLRQDPGRGNALGRIKFMFPNQFAIYLHDTPSRYLFQRARRAFSHGCIRVEKPIDLAVRLLAANGGWSAERIEAAIRRGRNQTITLKHPVPVHLVYLTAWRSENGVYQFRNDLYGRDKRVATALFSRTK